MQRAPIPVRCRSAVTIRALRHADLPAALRLWKSTAGLAITPDDTLPRLALFLRRNPGYSAAAVRGGRLVGCVLCGCDLRRGFLYHLAVSPAQRGAGVASALVAHCIARLDQVGVTRCNILVLRDNPDGLAFWLRQGWLRRDDVLTLQLRFGSEAAPAPCQRSLS